jgi:hypothetical protein
MLKSFQTPRVTSGPSFRVPHGMLASIFAPRVFHDDSEDSGSGDGSGSNEEEVDPLDKPSEMTHRAVNALAERKAKAAVKKATEETAAKLIAAEKELEKFRKTGEKPGEKHGEKTYTQSDIDKILAERDNSYGAEKKALTDKVNALQAHRKNSAIISEAAKAKAIDPDVILSLLDRQISIDEDGDISVLGSDGEARLNVKTGKPFTVADLIAETLEAKPFLKSGSGANGAGSNTKNGKQSPDVSKMSSEEQLARAMFPGHYS